MLKPLTEKFSRTITRIITLILIIPVTAGLIPLVSTTIKADPVRFTYITYLLDVNNGGEYCFVSNDEPHVYASTANASTYSKVLGLGVFENYIYPIAYSTAVNDWVSLQVTWNDSTIKRAYIYGTSTQVSAGVVPLYIYIGPENFGTLSNFYIITNASLSAKEQSLFYAYSNDLSQLPQGLTEEKVQDIINESLNNTTEAGQQANTIINNTTNQYNLYLSGSTSKETMLQNVENNIDTLSNLTPSTILDAMSINNGLTYNQTIQDKLLNTTSSNISSQITGKINQANQTFQNYSEGTTTQTEAVTQINQYITQLTNLITAETPTADIEAINTAINTINGIKDSVTSHSDLDNSVSESAQQSDQEELEYLENIEAETTDSIDTLKSKVDNSINETQANQVKNNVIAPILQNTLIVKVLPIAALFMVLAVTLGFKYRL